MRALAYSALGLLTAENLSRSIHREFCSSRFSGLSLGAFIKFNQLNWIGGSSRQQFVLVVPYVVRSTILAITATAELLI